MNKYLLKFAEWWFNVKLMNNLAAYVMCGIICAILSIGIVGKDEIIKNSFSLTWFWGVCLVVLLYILIFEIANMLEGFFIISLGMLVLGIGYSEFFVVAGYFTGMNTSMLIMFRLLDFLIKIKLIKIKRKR